VRELIVQVLDSLLHSFSVGGVRRSAEILFQRAHGLGLVALALVGGRDGPENPVPAAVD
jgi:hypothetical protein